jgi:hypothetical protein
MEQPERRGPEAEVRPFRYDATGLRGKRMRVMYDAGDLHEALLGARDVICIDDTPNTLHDLRVHPVGLPDVVFRVDANQLGIYGNQL